MKTKLIIFALSSLLAAQATAQENTLESVMVNNCPSTPQIWEIKPVPKIRKSNNLRRNTGSPEFAEGGFITIEGRVVDKNCVPIANAVVEIWQANAEGVYQYEEGNYDKQDSNFHSSGTAITNNLGYYHFLSVFPGPSKGRAPHINFRVRHVDFLPIETEMFFEAQALNDKDTMLKQQVNKNEKKLLIANGEPVNPNNILEGIKYRFDITLDGQSRYKRY